MTHRIDAPVHDTEQPAVDPPIYCVSVQTGLEELSSRNDSVLTVR